MSTFDPHAERLWSKEEDKQLRNAVFQEKEQKRPVKWDTIAASLPRRSKKECRKRWHHTMMEAVRRCKWKPEEDERLNTAVRKFGRKWISVAQVVMTRNDNECMRRWKEIQARDANATPTATPGSPSSIWSLDELNQTQSHPQHASISSNISSTSYSPSTTSYVDDLLRGMGQMSPQTTQFDSIDTEPLAMHSLDTPTGLMDSRGPEIHQDLDAFIDFDAERSGNFFEPRYDSDGHQSDSSEWGWFDSMMPATTHGGRPQYDNNGLSIGSGGFMLDSHPGELMHDSPGALDSSYSSTRSNSVVPQMQPQVSTPQAQDSYDTGNRNLLSLKSSGAVGGVKVVIVCKSNDLRTLSSLENIMKSLKANGHSVLQDSQPLGRNDYLCGSLAYDDVLQDLVGACT